LARRKAAGEIGINGERGSYSKVFLRGIVSGERSIAKKNRAIKGISKFIEFGRLGVPRTLSRGVYDNP